MRDCETIGLLATVDDEITDVVDAGVLDAADCIEVRENETEGVGVGVLVIEIVEDKETVTVIDSVGDCPNELDGVIEAVTGKDIVTVAVAVAD